MKYNPRVTVGMLIVFNILAVTASVILALCNSDGVVELMILSGGLMIVAAAITVGIEGEDET